MGAIITHLIDEQGATMQEAKIALARWEIRPIEYQGQKIGEIMMMENEVHMALDKNERNKLGRRGLLYKYLKDLLSEKGFLVTRLFKNDKYQKKIEAMGFKLTHSDSEYNYFWLNEI